MQTPHGPAALIQRQVWEPRSDQKLSKVIGGAASGAPVRGCVSLTRMNYLNHGVSGVPGSCHGC